jgi:hypothetical protein
MYYHAANRAYDDAVRAEKKTTRAEANFRKLELKESELLKEDDNDEIEAELESIAIQMESAHDDLGTAYGPFLKSIAMIHILCAAALESHINLLADEFLSGKDFDHFEKLALEAKWLFLPRLLQHHGFDPGSAPFQDFAQLVRYRNLLVHYKGHVEAWQQGRAPEFLKKLGLTIDDAQSSLQSVKKMISAIRTKIGKPLPYWLTINVNETSYFQIYFPNQELQRRMDEAARKYAETHDPKFKAEVEELRRRLEELLLPDE